MASEYGGRMELLEPATAKRDRPAIAGGWWEVGMSISHSDAFALRLLRGLLFGLTFLFGPSVMDAADDLVRPVCHGPR